MSLLASKLIERLGPPPRVVCQDWLAQLEAMAAALPPTHPEGTLASSQPVVNDRESERRLPADANDSLARCAALDRQTSHRSPSEPIVPGTPIRWSDLEVLEDGHLRLRASPNRSTDFDTVIAQLKQWMARVPPAGAQDSTTGHASRPEHSVAQSENAVQGRGEPEVVASTVSVGSSSGGSRGDSLPSSASGTAAGITKTIAPRRGARRSTRFAWWGVVGGACGLFAVLVLAIILWPTNGPPMAQHRPGERTAQVESTHPSSGGSSTTLPPHRIDPAPGTTMGATAITTSDDWVASGVVEPPDPSAASPSQGALETPLPLDAMRQSVESTSPIESSYPGTQETPTGGGPAEEGAVGIRPGSHPMPDDAPLRSIVGGEMEISGVAEVEKIAEQYRGEVTEKELTAASGSDPQGAWQKFVLNLDSMVHRYKLPPSESRRTRHSEWELQLIASEGLAVAPSSVARVARKQSAAWTIRPAGSDDASATAVVQVRGVGSRGDSLQFLIFATHSQVPGVQLPIAPPFLDAVRGRLLWIQQQLTAAEQHWDRLADSGGDLPGEIIRARRKQIDQQSRRIAELLECIADTARLEVLMDGRVEVKLRCIDAAPTTDSGDR